MLHYLESVDALAFNTLGDTLAVGLRNGAVYEWHAQSDSNTGELLGSHSAGAVDLLAFSPDGRNLASYSGAALSLIIWDLMRQKNDKKLTSLNFERVNTLGFSPDSRLLAFNSGRIIMLCAIAVTLPVQIVLYPIAGAVAIGCGRRRVSRAAGSGDGAVCQLRMELDSLLYRAPGGDAPGNRLREPRFVVPQCAALASARDRRRLDLLF